MDGVTGDFSADIDESIAGGTPTGAKSINKITGSAKQVKNITVNIDSFVKGGINTANTELQQMNGEQIEEWFTEKMLRVIRNLELSY